MRIQIYGLLFFLTLTGYPLHAQVDSLIVHKVPSTLVEITTQFDYSTSWWRRLMENRFAQKDWKRFVHDSNYEMSEYASSFSDVKRPLVEVLKSESMTAVMYKWALPTIKARWEGLTMHEKCAIVLALEHGKKYLADFSKEEEEAYYRAMQDIRYPIGVFGWSYGNMGKLLYTRRTPQDFYEGDYRKPHPFHHPYRRIETFLYRRIKDGVSVNLLKTYIDKLLQEFVLPINQSFADSTESGQFKNGKPDGIWQLYQESERYGMVRTDSGNYVNGVKEGIWVSRGTYDPKDTTWDTYEQGKKVKSEYHSYWKTHLSFIWIIDLKECHRIDKRFAAGRKIKEQIFPFKFDVK